MSTEKFTPGEWTVFLDELHDEIFDHLEYGIWKRGENKLIVRFETWDATRFAESKANAYLIAAAPEMYALLKMIADPATFMGSLTNNHLRIAIESILKKARGDE